MHGFILLSALPRSLPGSFLCKFAMASVFLFHTFLKYLVTPKWLTLMHLNPSRHLLLRGPELSHRSSFISGNNSIYILYSFSISGKPVCSIPLTCAQTHLFSLSDWIFVTLLMSIFWSYYSLFSTKITGFLSAYKNCFVCVKHIIFNLLWWTLCLLYVLSIVLPVLGFLATLSTC